MTRDPTDRIRIGTRTSRLAMAQSRLVAQALSRDYEGLKTELVPIVTSGDRRRGPLADAGGKGLFTVELEASLRSGQIDLAVHSAKDLPTHLGEGLCIAAVPARADPRDALVMAEGTGVEGLRVGARVGTGSLRRAVQLRAIRDDLGIVPIRGNVETRVARALPRSDKVRRLDAVVLAMAGLQRSGLLEIEEGTVAALSIDHFTPAAGQGALAVEILEDREELKTLLAPINDALSFHALRAERDVLADLGADCHSCIGVHVRREPAAWLGAAIVGDLAGHLIRCEARAQSAEAVGRLLCLRLREQGGMGLLKS